jgi:hypothetical protein
MPTRMHVYIETCIGRQTYICRCICLHTLHRYVVHIMYMHPSTSRTIYTRPLIRLSIYQQGLCTACMSPMSPNFGRTCFGDDVHGESMYFRNVGHTAHLHKGQRPKRRINVKSHHSENQNSVNTCIHVAAPAQLPTSTHIAPSRTTACSWRGLRSAMTRRVMLAGAQAPGRAAYARQFKG